MHEYGNYINQSILVASKDIGVMLTYFWHDPSNNLSYFWVLILKHLHKIGQSW